ncbi:hypothetical protein VKT23_014677 [Stygiomarasmius scandens]|uniref:Tail assembly chaperone n=1 Tax=Marasmiellus scandens TaxID=2682957 RepID=A0ABR1J2D2_9AGAR
MTSPRSVSSRSVPALAWARSQKRFTSNVVPFTGLLSIEDQARINDWFKTHVAGASTCEHLWVAGVPVAHARTLVTAAMERDDIVRELPDSFQETDVIEIAWERLMHNSGLTASGSVQLETVDVELEALKILEYWMFNLRDEAGEAGNMQWGLDNGMHQNGWNPWDVYAPECEIGYKRRVSPEAQQGPNYDYEEDARFQEQIIEAQKRVEQLRLANRPKPRPLKRRS